MKKIFITLIAATSLLGAHAQSGYTINGTAEGTAEGDTVYLCKMEGFFNIIPEDSTYIKNGKFTFSGNCSGAASRNVIALHGGKPAGMADIILENSPITIQMFKDQDKKPIIIGGPNSKLWAEFQTGENIFNEQMQKPWDTTRDSTATADVKAKAQHELDSLNILLKTYHKNFIVEHIPSGISDMLLGYYRNELNESELNDILALMKAKQSDMPVYKGILAEREATAKTALGQQYTDIALTGTTGKTVKVSDYVKKNKYTLIDFWASWCGPCRAEMPNVVKAYTLYHAKGLEVVGISLDNNKQAWINALKSLKMPWPQMSDLKGWQSAGAAAYNVKAIPANVLVNQKGEIIAKDLREAELQVKMKELFK